MSYEADARQELINRLRNVYSSQANAYSGAALDESEMEELAGYRDQMAKMRMPLTKAGRKSLSKARCPPKSRRVCTEAACIPSVSFPKYRKMQLSERALIKKGRSRAAKSGGKSKWAAHVAEFRRQHEEATGVPLPYKNALQMARSTYGASQGRGDKSGRKKRVPKPRTKKAATAIKKVEVAAVAAIDAGASPAQVVAAVEKLPAGLTLKQFAKTGRFKGLPKGPGQRRKRFEEYQETGYGFDQHYGSGRSGGVMMDSMYGEGGTGGVLMDVFDDYQ